MRFNLLFLVTAATLLLSPNLSIGQVAPNLGTSSTFALFTAAGAFNGDIPTSVLGDIGTNAGAFVGPGVLVGTSHIPPDPVAVLAATDVAAAYMALDVDNTCGIVLGTPFGNQTLTPNVYCLGGASVLGGNLTLDAAGNPNAIFIFKVGGALSTNPFSNIILTGGASLCNVYFRVNGAVDLGVNSVFQGTILAAGAISLLSGAVLHGRGLSTAGSISTNANVVDLSGACLVAGGPVPPTITCAAPVTVTCASQVPAADPSSVAVTVTCPGAFTVVFLGDVISNQTCANRFTITRTYQVTDACGGMAICAQMITVNDQTPPTITCPANVAVTCASQVPAANPASVITSDGCGGAVTVTSVDVISNQTCANRFTITRTYRATDVCGNFAECIQTITVNDQTAPTIVCPANVAVTCASQVPAADPASVITSDGCGGAVTVTSVDVISNQTCANRFTITRTYRATDVCGNFAECIQTITVNDQTAPTITCPANVAVTCASLVPAADPASVITSDGCGGAVTVTSVDVISNQICANRFTIARTYRATDLCGNFAECIQTITVNDQTAPTITCPANVAVTCAGQVPAGSNTAAATSDNCGGAVTVTFSDVISNQRCANGFTITRTYQASDACSNVAICAQTITVNDLVAPTITCPANITVSCASLVPTATPGSVITSDGCGGAVTVTSTDVISNQTCANRFTITRTYRATDLCGNFAECIQTITVNDQTAPIITCPANISVSCANQVPAPDPASVVTSDDCGGQPIVAFVSDVISNQICVDRFTVTRTYSATDACGNVALCAQIITVNGVMAAPIICPADVTVSCASLVPAANPASIIIGVNCGGQVTVTSVDVISNQICANRFTITRTYTATDACGGMAICAQTITVFDQMPPTIACPANVAVTCAGQVPAGSNTAAATGDNCGGAVTVTFADVITNQTCINRFTNTRTYTAIDACGNMANCAQTITVNDQTPPTIVCPSNVSVSCASQVPAGSNTAATTGDNCGGAVTVTFNDVLTNQICTNRFTDTRTYTATDACGNQANCVQTITVNDQTPPTIVCPANVSVSCANQAPVGSNTAPTTGDNCGGAVTVTFNDVITNQTCINRFTNTRTYTANDACGNQANCVQTITVFDQTLPTLTCPANVTVSCASQVPTSSTTAVIANDNCGGAVNVTLLSDLITNQTCASRFTETRIYQAIDLCGNMANCTQTITVFDQTLPTLVCPANVTVSCAGQVPTGSITAVTAANDNCGGAVTIALLGDVITNQTCANRFTDTRTYRATDLCGNQAICAQIITVFDQTLPTITCPRDANASCASQVLPIDLASVTTADNCGGLVTLTSLDVISNQICANRFTITRTVTATDACGNRATCAQIITVFDNILPIITCPANVSVSCASNVPAATPGTILASDFCAGAVTVTYVGDVITNMTCANRFVGLRTYQATDICGNFATCVQTITVQDQATPRVICPANVTVSCTSQVPAINPASVIMTENCSDAATTIFVSDVNSSQLCPNQFSIVRTYQATDVCGNSAICAQTITVQDQTPMGITCPANAIVPCSSQMPPPNPASVAVSDNCGGQPSIALIGEVMSNQTCANRYTIARAYQAVDLCGNISTCIQSITVNDQTPPVFDVLPQNLSVECMEGLNGEVELENWLSHFGFAQVSNFCGTDADIDLKYVLLSDVKICGDYTFTRTYEFRATDVCGNTTYVQATFSLVDNTPPVIVKCPPGSVLLSCESAIPEPDPSALIAYDNCGGHLKIMPVISSNGTGCLGYPLTRNYWYMVTDECGNMSNCDQSFQIIDSIPPTYSGPDTIDVGCIYDLPGPSGITALLAPYMSDNCSETVCLTQGASQSGSNSVTYCVKGKDLCGNWGNKFNITFIATGACRPLCTASQTTWGNQQASINGVGTTQAVAHLITKYGGVTAGKLGKTVTVTSAGCLQSMLPGTTNTNNFAPGQVEFSAANNCQPSSPLLNNNGTLKNKLTANILALQLNIWYNREYNQRNLGVQQLSTLPACLVDPILLNHMANNFATVQDLLSLGNEYVSGVGFSPQNFSVLLNEALDNINKYWQNCQVNDLCSAQLRAEGQTGNQLLQVNLSPNPVMDIVTLDFDAVTDTELQVRFIGSTGAVEKSEIIQVVKGINTLSFSTKTFPAGLYNVILLHGKDIQTLRMVKVNN